MEEENKEANMKHSYNFSPLFILLLLHLFFIPSTCVYNSITDSYSDYSFTPSVNYLIDCGSSFKTQLQDGRIFKSDRETTSFLSTTEDIQISVDSLNLMNLSHSSALPLYETARVFTEDTTYTFYISQMGRLWIRLYFFPLPNPTYNLSSSVFSVHTDHFVLLHEFSQSNNDSLVFKEYLVNVSYHRFSLKFKPKKNSFAFINAIEIVSAPDILVWDSAIQVTPPLKKFDGLMNSALQVSYRINVGGPMITPGNDTLSRTWESDVPYNIFPQGSVSVSVPDKRIKYSQTSDFIVTPLIAPNSIYATCVKMEDPRVMQPNFNLSWMVNVEERYSYLIRMHFCDIVSRRLDELYFNVYLNGIECVSALDLSYETKALSTAYYMDFVIGSSNITNGTIVIQVGPTNHKQDISNAILNGFEVMKMSNSADSLDGFFSVDGEYKGPSLTTKLMKLVAIIGFSFAVISLLLLGVMYVKWLRSPLCLEERKNFFSWLLPLHSKCNISCSIYSNKYDSPKSKHGGGHSIHHSPRRGSKRFFHFIELQRATGNFDEKKVLGVGGFGKVYLGTMDDGRRVAIKRGSGSSGQGMNEFITELNMLSKLRHRHLVSLVGFCDENSEMVLVYDYVSNGPFRSHLYGSNISPLSWEKRLEICIGAARGLHYLHTGASQSIIHRDVKTTNILLDENYVAKVADFGLSKTIHDKAQISTAVKGSFGYLDPEYFKSQQLTQKSDIYSFGVVLFEVLCARPVICSTLPLEQANLADWVVKQHKSGMLHKAVDPRIANTINPESYKVFVQLGVKCLSERSVDRPSMGDVLWNLEHAYQIQIASPHVDNTISKAFQNANESDINNDNSHGVTRNEHNRINSGSLVFSQIDNFQGR
ncbi:probable receptor-like protein kinase At5g61350 [Lathyrus oleraceus]|uniref:Protein kinase domain-containing protein n=1 Tax=Pisum sativum TaxID=3888 RepID=A0A9D4X8Q8_PEA|nr:probable receptor-like protein kinase At5g61350 [Pisum sativum]KAI5416654.1 hypothetical protein KIW84_041618 [Pisum sativum]